MHWCAVQFPLPMLMMHCCAEPAETDPAPMVHKSDHTAGLAGKIQYGACLFSLST